MTEAKIKFGVAAFNVPDSFRDSLQTLQKHADSITVVYGRFKGFPHPWVDPPEWLEDLCTSLIISDDKLEQHKQRDIYLEGVNDDDIFFVMDADTIPVITDRTFSFFKRLKNWDSGLVTIVEKTGSQSVIWVYNYRDEWKHSPGQLFWDKRGKFVCNPAYRVEKIPQELLFYIHNSMKELDPAYKKAYLQHWENIKIK